MLFQQLKQQLTQVTLKLRSNLVMTIRHTGKIPVPKQTEIIETINERLPYNTKNAYSTDSI